MGSKQFDKLDKDRRGQYAAEAARLLGALDDDARRELLRGRENRDAMRNMMMETMDQNARRLARGQEMQWPGFGWGRRGNGEGRRERPQREELSEEEREARRKERMERFNQMMRDQIGSGNSQDSALRGEMFQKMMQGGGGFPGRGGRRGGGGGRGGGGA